MGGNDDLFKKTKIYLENECKIQIIASYLDKYDTPHYIDPSLYHKTLVFFPTNKTGIIFSPLLKKGHEVLKSKKISPYKNYNNIVNLRTNTLLYNDTLMGMDTTFFPSKKDLKIDTQPILERSHSTSVLENQILPSSIIEQSDSESESESESKSNFTVLQSYKG